MSIISLITDFGLKDNFVGVIKAVILKINPSARIVDICHTVSPQDIREAAFLLRGSYRYFPVGTVHLVVVDPGVGSQRKRIIAQTKDYFFVAPDNGVLALALKDGPLIKIIEITNDSYFLKPTSDTFHARDIFAPIAAYLSKGLEPECFGSPIQKFKYLNIASPKLKGNCLEGEIIYIDRFGNLVTNIDKWTLEKFIKHKKFKIFIKDKIIEKLSHNYIEGIKSKPLALIDSFDCLEIALSLASARDYFKVTQGEVIKVKRE